MPDLAASARPLGRSFLLIAGLAAAGYALRTLPVHDFAQHAGRLGSASFVLLGAAACAVGLPRQIVAFAAGYAHGIWQGAVLALLAQLLGCLADLLWARLLARVWVRAHSLGTFGARLARLQTFLAAHPFTATLTLRLLPVGNNLALNLLAGAFAVPVAPFLAATAIGYLPQTLIFVMLAKGVRIGQSTEIAIALGTFVLSTVLGMVLMRRAKDAA